jgi:hypothetical protein
MIDGVSVGLVVTVGIFLLGHLLTAVAFAARLQGQVKALADQVSSEVSAVRDDLDRLVKEVTGTRKDFDDVRLNSERIERLRSDVASILVELRDLPVIRSRVMNRDPL